MSFDDDAAGATPRRRQGGGGGNEEKAEKRRLAQEKRDQARERRQEEAARKKAERTRSQVRAQAIKLGRKYRDAGGGGSLSSPFSGLAIEEGEPARLELGPIVRQANGDLVLARADGAAALSFSEGGSPFEHSFQTLQQLARAPPDAAPKRRKELSAVMDATNNAPVLHRNPAVVVVPGGAAAAAGLPGSPVAAAAAAASPTPPLPLPPPPPPIAARLPGIAIGPASSTTATDAARNEAHAPPRYGALRGGTLPTYRQYVGQQSSSSSSSSPARGGGGGGRLRPATGLGNELSEEQRQEQARLEKELQDLAIARQYENLTRLYNTLPELRRAPLPGHLQQQQHTQRRRAPPLLQPRSVPQQRRTVRRVYRVGRTDRELSMLTHSATTRASVDDFRLHMQNVPTDKMRRALLAAKLLHAGSEAPEPLVRRIFQQRQLLVGDLVVA